FFPEAPPDKRAITLEQLLTHTSGIVENYAADGITERDAAVQAIFAQPLGTPGEFHYTNDSYVLLGAVVEVASGEPLETFFSEQLFQPAGLRDSGFWGFVDIDDATRFAHIQGDIPQERRLANWGDRAASGVISTAGDLYRWWRALQTDRVLPRQSVQDLFAPRVNTESGTQIAAGWYWTRTARDTRALWTRGTEDFGHNALLLSWIDEGFTLAMTTNAGEIDGEGWNKRMPAEVEAILWPGTAP
ncbi:MAG TPA: serine hydrolase domain-containing protein, partial [Thermoanaerobaculia bacterium]|nr:serine hydrolase domain-containing protein [Thermoanaerobaculia bacterium]